MAYREFFNTKLKNKQPMKSPLNFSSSPGIRKKVGRGIHFLGLT